MAIHNPQGVGSDSKNIYFNKINQTIRLFLNSMEDKLELHLIGKIISRGHLQLSEFINLLAIPIYVMFTRFDEKHYI